MSEDHRDDRVTQIEQLLRTVAGSIRRKGRAILVNFDITPAQFDALLHIDHGRNKTIGDLSARLGLAYSTTTDLVDRMERREFVERVKDDDDKRMVRVRPLAKGQELIEQVMAARREYVAAILKNVSDEESDSVLAALQLLSKHLGD